MKKKYLVIILLLFSALGLANAQEKLNLEKCRSLALKNNKELKISDKELEVAQWENKAARANYFPKVSALGTYMRSQKEMSLLSDEQKTSLQNIGTTTAPKLQQLGGAFAQKYPQLAPMIQYIGQSLGSQLVPALDELGNSLVNGLRTDTRNLYVGAINLTQPIYVGGKIRAYGNITNYLEQIADSKHKLSTQELLLQTDEAYWRVVSLSHKKKLADSYVKLLEKMEADIEKMIAEGVATKADGLTVKVKLNEAEMQQTKANNGVALSKMTLCQICGLPISDAIVLADEEDENLRLDVIKANNDLGIAFENRPEIQSLTLAGLAKKEKVKIERSEFLPQIAFTGNYMVTNPATFNGFENKFRGMWTLGLQVKVPIWHWGEGAHKVNIAKAEAEIIDYKLEEAKEKITLQVNQAKFKVVEADKQLAMSEKNVEKAEENLRYAKLGFSEGVIPPSDVLKAHTAWFDAESDKIDAQINVKLSQVSLEKALGTLSTEQYKN